MKLETVSASNFHQQSKLAVELATAAIRAGDVIEAQRLLHERLASAPNDSNATAKLAEIAIRLDRIEQGTILLRRAAVTDPSLERRLALIRHLKAHVGPAAALKEIEESPLDVRRSFDVRGIEAAMHGMLGQLEREIAIYNELLRDFPGHPGLWRIYGDSLKTFGRTEDAVAAVRQAIKLLPTFGEAYWALANFKSFRFSDADIAAMKRALRGKLSDDDALHIHFALGKAFEDRKSYAHSFRHYSAGNAVRAKSLLPAQTRVTPTIDASIGLFNAAFFEQRTGIGHSAHDPIFVLGLHRSGSTLIEQILASHPLIEGTTELIIIPQIWDRLARKAAAAGRTVFQQAALLEADELEAIGREYCDRARPFRLTDKPYFVDKLPANWMYLGLIRLALPNAKIIDARRHPMACGLSNFKQHYASGVNFAYSLESIGTFYRDYWRFMRHIDEVQPGAVHRVLNERLIDDPEGETRALLDFIGVPFDAACLEFHRNTRAVMTPSAEQVRRPINRDGVDSWRPYEPWLDPLKRALGDALENWDKPSAIQ